MFYFLYIARCCDKSLYVGYTSNIPNRESTHNNRKGSKYLLNKLPIKIIYFEQFNTRLEAMRRERQIKGWRREKKENLIKYGKPITSKPPKGKQP